MKFAYFYEEKLDKDVTMILKESIFLYINYTIIESDIMKTRRSKGYFLYIEDNKDNKKIKILDNKLREIGVEKLYGEEKSAILDIFDISKIFT